MKPKKLRKRDNTYWCAKYYAENKEKVLEYHRKRYQEKRKELLLKQKIYDDIHRVEKRKREKIRRYWDK